jgi:probable rRNA maturation factor
MRVSRCPGRAAIDVALVDDAVIARLNWRFLRHRGPTDVITFPAGDRSEEGVLGEIVISVDRAREQARRHGHPVRQEVALLIVHGILHLRGYDDRTSIGAAKMQTRAEAILERVLERRR